MSRHVRLVAAVCGGLLASVSLVGCAGNAPSATSSTGGAANGGTVDLTIASSIGASDLSVFESMIAKFNEENPGIKVTNTTADASTLLAELPQLVASGQAYDLVLTNESTITPFAALGALSPYTADELSSLSIDSADYIDPLWNLTQYKDETYGLPFSSTATVMYSNDALLKELGLEIPTTLDAFTEAGRQCTVDSAGLHPGDGGFSASSVTRYGFGVNIDAWALLGQSLVKQFGGTIENGDDDADFATPAVESAMSRIMSFVSDGIAPAPTMSETDMANFQSGNSCFFVSGAWNVQGFKDAGLEFTLSPLPTLGEQPGEWGAGAFVSLPKQSSQYSTAKRDAALKFAAWMTSDEANLLYAESDNLPSRKAPLTSDALTSLPVGNVLGALNDMYIVGGYPWVSQMNAGFSEAYEAIVKGADIPSTLEKVSESTNQQIEIAKQTYTN